MANRSMTPVTSQNGLTYYPSGQGAGPARPPPSSRAASTTSSTKKKDNQLSTIEKSVTHLLIATKQLLETLTQWSRKNATETQVSDVYVRLGYEFNIACRAFASINVDVSDLGNVPDALRQILEETLSQEASQKSLDFYLPKIRDIIINLLHGLKRKQAKLRAKAKEGQTLPRTASGGSVSTTTSGVPSSTGLTEMLDDIPSNYPPSRRESSPIRRQSSQIEESRIPARNSSNHQPRELRDEPPQHAPITVVNGMPSRQSSNRDDSPEVSSRYSRERKQPAPSVSSLPSDIMQNIPVIAPYDSRQAPRTAASSYSDDLPPPPPPPKQSEALLALQRGGELERRASRRYSAYQIQKLVGGGPGGVPNLPPQNSPIPNRGRDNKESLNAVRTRTSMMISRQRSTRLRESPSMSANRISEEYSAKEREAQPRESSPIRKISEDSASSPYAEAGRDTAGAGVSSTTDHILPDKPVAERTQNIPVTTLNQIRQDSVEQEQFIPEQSPQPGKELTLFLQYKSKIKKIVLADGANDLSMAGIQLAFIEKFQWNTNNHDIDLPEIYVQDQVSGVRHELEDLSDIKDRSVLVLNVEPMEEVKKHFDAGLGNLSQLVEGIKTTVDGQQVAIAQVSNRQEATAKEIARLASIPLGTMTSNTKISGNAVAWQEIKALRGDMDDVRGMVTSFHADVETTFAAIREKATQVKAKAIEVEVPIMDNETGLAYVNLRKEELGKSTEQLIENVDDLQDYVEDLRKDVVSRGVRPLPRQLEQVGRDISVAHQELHRIKEFVKKEKPIWTKVWTQMLEDVMTLREYLTLQEDFITDLEQDLTMAQETFSLVEQATKQQMAENAEGKPAVRTVSRTIPVDTDPARAKDNVLGEVRALRPNHETRLEAIERAERQRKEELQHRADNVAFKKELGNFVQEGKLRKTTSIAELERQIKEKEEIAMRQEHEDVENVKILRAKARAEERARQAEAQIAAMDNGGEDEDGDKFEDAPESEADPPTPPAKDGAVNGHAN